MPSQLSPKDQAKVNQYLGSPQHQVQRQPFRPWRLLAILLITVIALGLLSRLLSQLA